MLQQHGLDSCRNNGYFDVLQGVLVPVYQVKQEPGLRLESMQCHLKSIKS